MSNFFNAIGVADMEKVHSAMIAWILNDSNAENKNGFPPSESKFTTFPLEERSKFLCGLFSINEPKTFTSIIAHVEWNDIDIMIETKDDAGEKEIWVIENKLKSPEHMSNEKDTFEKDKSVWQTTKYEDIINSEFKNDEKHYLFLSLLGEEAESPSEQWKSFTYQQLQKLLIDLLDLSNYSIVEEYANAINKMIMELNSFIADNDKRKYPHVFNKLKISEKAKALLENNIKVEEKYIVENGLETIFQKCFLKEVIKKTKKYQQHSNRINIRETHGTALWEYTYTNVMDTNLCVQFQNGTFKVQVSKKIIDKNTSSHIVEDFWNNWKGIFEKLSLGSNWKEKPNKSKEQKGPYFSFSMKKGQSDNKPWYSSSQDNIARHWDEMIQQCEEALDIIKGYC